MSESDVLLERDGSVAVIRLDRPAKRNALTVGTLRRLRAAVEDAVAEGAVAIVVHGGDECFSAGIDLWEVGAGVEDAAVDEEIALSVAAIRMARIPVVAAIEGPCIGAGLDLALACDVRIAGVGSSFGLPATRLGLLYRIEGLRSVLSELGPQTAATLLLFDESLDAAAAERTGLVARRVPKGQALAAGLELAGRAAGCVREAVALTKTVLGELAGGDIDVERWEARRRELLASTARLEAVEKARRR
jgi:enoyl-CoA hydratase/carnithine racemase